MHTLPPWRVFRTPDGYIKIVSACGGEIATLDHCEKLSTGSQDKNAGLILAAPILYIALNALQANPNSPAAHRAALDALRMANTPV